MKKITQFLVFTLILIAASSPALAAKGKAYKIRPGDVLQITVWKEDALDQEVVVLPDGSITFPLIGTLDVEDHTPSQVQNIIKNNLKDYVPDASVAVAVKANLGHSVNVIGQVAKPGEFVMNRQMSVMQALSQAGGLTPFASEGRIIVLRREEGKEVAIHVPYDDIIDGDSLDQNLSLLPGDVVVVPTASLF